MILGKMKDSWNIKRYISNLSVKYSRVMPPVRFAFLKNKQTNKQTNKTKQHKETKTKTKQNKTNKQKNNINTVKFNC